MSYMTISSQENHHFSLCSYFHAHPTTLHLKILGGPMHGPSPHLKFLGGPSPLSPRSPPLGDGQVDGKSYIGRRISIKLPRMSQHVHEDKYAHNIMCRPI